MIRITKIFHFETAHAVHGYIGKCSHIHGHSYELHVCVAAREQQDEYIAAPGFVVDFKQLKQWVQAHVVELLDHSLVLSRDYITAHPHLQTHTNLCVWEMEPTAENILLFIRKQLQPVLPPELQLVHLKLYETRDSFAEWVV